MPPVMENLKKRSVLAPVNLLNGGKWDASKQNEGRPDVVTATTTHSTHASKQRKDYTEEDKFNDIINQNTEVPHETEPPRRLSKKSSNNILPASAARDEDDFNELLKSSPKKKPKGSHAKDREWERLEMITTEKKNETGLDDLMDNDFENKVLPSP